jgi:hypothetical protein
VRESLTITASGTSIKRQANFTQRDVALSQGAARVMLGTSQVRVHHHTNVVMHTLHVNEPHVVRSYVWCTQELMLLTAASKATASMRGRGHLVVHIEAVKKWLRRGGHKPSSSASQHCARHRVQLVSLNKNTLARIQNCLQARVASWVQCSASMRTHGPLLTAAVTAPPHQSTAHIAVGAVGMRRKMNLWLPYGISLLLLHSLRLF